MNDLQITTRLEEIAAELASIDAAIVSQSGVQSYTKGNDQTQLHPINTLYNRKSTLEKERRDLLMLQLRPPLSSAQSYTIGFR